MATTTIEQLALSILETYEGGNNYILNLKSISSWKKTFTLTRAQSEYIVNFSEVPPKVAKKWIELDPYFAQKIADEKFYTQAPENVWVEKLLAEKEKAYHIWGKLFEQQEIHEFWLPKAALIVGTTVGKIDIDYSKYNNRPPMEHQKEAIEKLVGSKRFILADEMGLAKTGTSIIAALEIKAERILIVCPASLKINWQRELEFYTDKSIFICEGKKFSLEHDIVIINYDILKNFYTSEKKEKEESLIYKFNPDLIICDEAHYLQGNSIRSKLVKAFAPRAKYLWLLTGTPMTSRPINYYNLLNLIDNSTAQNWVSYVIRYCGGYQFKLGNGKKIWNTGGAKNLEELRNRTSKQVLRRLKTEVLDLPDKIITPVFLKLKSTLYEEYMGEYYEWLDGQKEETSITLQFSMLTKVRMLIAMEKIPITIDLAESAIEEGHKVVIFSNFTEPVKTIFEHFKKTAVYLDGSCSAKKRQEAIDRFQNDEKVKVFVGNIIAAGIGITLTAGDVVIKNDLSFVPAHHAQAEDRCMRIGQKSNVSIQYPIFENTIEKIIYNMLQKKKNIFETVMGDNLDKGDMMSDTFVEINTRRKIE